MQNFKDAQRHNYKSVDNSFSEVFYIEHSKRFLFSIHIQVLKSQFFNQKFFARKETKYEQIIVY
jgi:hypothetical protein